MTNLLILIALLQVCTVAFIVYLVSRHNRLLFPIPKGKNTYEARNAMVEILVLKIRGYLTSVQWFAELLQGHSGGELTEEQSQLVAQLAGEFVRPGVKGQLIVAPDHFELDAQLGFLLGAFSARIESEIEKNLDALLASSSKAKPAAKKAAAKKSARK